MLTNWIKVSGSPHTTEVRPTVNGEKARVNETCQPKSDEKQVNNSVMPVTDNDIMYISGSGKARALLTVGGKGRGRTKGKLLARDGKTFNSTGMPQIVRVVPNNRPYRVVQTIEETAWLSSLAVSSVSNAKNFQVNQINQVSTLTSLFDQYRITRVEVWLIPRNTTVIGNTSNTGLLHSVVDFDDSNVLGGINDALDYQNCLVTSGDVGHYRTWVPHIAVAAYSGAFTSFANEAAPWIDAASPTVQHYGLKAVWSTTDSPGYTYDLIARLHTEWRNVR